MADNTFYIVHCYIILSKLDNELLVYN